MTFSKEVLQGLAGAQSLKRGVAYHAVGKVTKLIKRGDVYEAAVQGSGRYQQTIDLRGEESKGNCSCPYSQDGWCKHLVAVGLAILGEEYTEVAEDYDKLKSYDPIPFQQFWKKTGWVLKSEFNRFLCSSFLKNSQVCRGNFWLLRSRRRMESS